MKKVKFYYVLPLLIFIISILSILKVTESNSSSLSNKKVALQNETVQVEAKESNASNTGSALIPKTQFTIVVDAGHGDWDPGSMGPDGTKEKNISLAVALKLGRILESKSIKVIYTRKSDVVTMTNQKEELLYRADLANKNEADLYISIHLNSSDYKEVKGTETYYHLSSSKSKKLASMIQSQIVKDVKSKDRGIRSEDYSVLRNVKAPSVLVELGYISNYSEEAQLKKDAYQEKMAQAIAAGIIKYMGK